MLTKGQDKRNSQAEIVLMEDLVPPKHLLRSVNEVLDFEFVYELVEDSYCADNGRPSIDPVVLIKIVLIQYMFGIRSMRQTIEEIKVNAAYRWFLGMTWQDSVPHFTTFGKNYSRRFVGTDLFEQIFAHILEKCYKAGFVKDGEIFVDATHIKASANRSKKVKARVQQEAAAYGKVLCEEINAERVAQGKKPFDDDDPPQDKEITQSTTDPESGMFHKGEHERNFAYMAQTACNRHGFVLGYEVVPGNVHDSKSFWKLYEQIKEKDFDYLVADAGYKTRPYCISCSMIISFRFCLTPGPKPKKDILENMITSTMYKAIVTFVPVGSSYRKEQLTAMGIASIAVKEKYVKIVHM